MKIVCFGGGPAGLYFAISMKLKNPSHEVEVYERNKSGDTFGWGVVFSDQTMDNLLDNDPKSAAEILDSFAHWDNIDVFYDGNAITSGGHGFCGIGRQKLLDILEERAVELGVKLIFEDELEVEDIDTRFADADLIIASDGINSKIRNTYPQQFEAEVETRSNKFMWLGTNKVFEAFTFIFKKTERGWIWVHAYRFDENTSTFIIECSEPTWKSFGFDKMNQDETCSAAEKLFAEHLDGHSLMSNAKHLRGSAWLNFNRVICNKWHYKNIVLLGDAAHTAHFSIGSGTKLAFEDAIKLASVLNDHDMGLEQALVQYKDERHLEVLRIQSSARNSTEWFENIDRYLNFDPTQFAYALLTRSQRVSHENLRLRDHKWLEGVESWFAGKAGDKSTVSTPPMFTPFSLRNMTLQNRVVVSPMCMYAANDGTIGDFHFVHYGARAQGGAGLIYTEMTDVCRDGRISPGCAGLYKDEHVTAWKLVVDFVHNSSKAKMAIQLAHAGRKGSTKRPWDGYDKPLDEGNWGILAPSAIAWDDENETPQAMTIDDMQEIKAAFVEATKRAELCGFDMVELHCAHGYLLSSFISPISNQRDDEFGGSLENRLRFPLEVFAAMREVWPTDKPMSVRISANDWVGDQGIDADDALEIAKAFKAAGVDIIDVSAGQTSPKAEPVYGRMFQTPFSDKIRNEAGIATIAVGNIFEPDHINSIITAGRADLCALARPHLADPNWTLRAAAAQNYHGVSTPVQYTTGFQQLERNLQREAEMVEKVIKS
jgi:anthraniloyl-CoA monooxygenase